MQFLCKLTNRGKSGYKNRDCHWCAPWILSLFASEDVLPGLCSLRGERRGVAAYTVAVHQALVDNVNEVAIFQRRCYSLFVRQLLVHLKRGADVVGVGASLSRARALSPLC